MGRLSSLQLGLLGENREEGAREEGASEEQEMLH